MLLKPSGGGGASVQDNFSATVDPTVNDDDTQGYAAGSRWINVSSDVEFVCVDASTGAAIWQTGLATPLSSTPPANVTKSAAQAGTSPTASRSDHKHDVAMAAAGTVGTAGANTEGTATSLARSDHTHDVELDSDEATATGSTTTGSLTDVALAGMAVTPGAGDYFAWFTTTVENDTNNTTIAVAFYRNGVQIAHSEREIDTAVKLLPKAVAHAARIVGLGAAETIEVRWRTSTGGSIATAHQRAIELLRLN